MPRKATILNRAYGLDVDAYYTQKHVCVSPLYLSQFGTLPSPPHTPAICTHAGQQHTLTGGLKFTSNALPPRIIKDYSRRRKEGPPCVRMRVPASRLACWAVYAFLSCSCTADPMHDYECVCLWVSVCVWQPCATIHCVYTTISLCAKQCMHMQGAIWHTHKLGMPVQYVPAHGVSRQLSETP